MKSRTQSAEKMGAELRKKGLVEVADWVTYNTVYTRKAASARAGKGGTHEFVERSDSSLLNKGGEPFRRSHDSARVIAGGFVPGNGKHRRPCTSRSGSNRGFLGNCNRMVGSLAERAEKWRGQRYCGPTCFQVSSIPNQAERRVYQPHDLPVGVGPQRIAAKKQTKGQAAMNGQIKPSGRLESLYIVGKRKMPQRRRPRMVTG